MKQFSIEWQYHNLMQFEIRSCFGVSPILHCRKIMPKCNTRRKLKPSQFVLLNCKNIEIRYTRLNDIPITKFLRGIYENHGKMYSVKNRSQMKCYCYGNLIFMALIMYLQFQTLKNELPDTNYLVLFSLEMLLCQLISIVIFHNLSSFTKTKPFAPTIYNLSALERQSCDK